MRAKKLAYEYGVKAEEIASAFLKDKYYIELCRRYKGLYGDIDLICLDGKVLVFIEVKASRTNYIPILTKKKIKKNCIVAAHFIQSNPEYNKYLSRFDYIIVHRNKVLQHQEYAWDWIECEIW